MTICSSCGNGKPEFSEGVCVRCSQAAQIEIEQHYREYDKWAGMSDKQREDAIKLTHG